MFLRNSITFVFLALWVFPFSFGTVKKQEIIIPKLQYEDTLKSTSNKIKVEKNLDGLHYNDQIIVRKEDEQYYYKVMEKALKSEQEIKEIPIKENDLLLYTQEKGNNYQTVVRAMNTGILLEDE